MARKPLPGSPAHHRRQVHAGVGALRAISPSGLTLRSSSGIDRWIARRCRAAVGIRTVAPAGSKAGAARRAKAHLEPKRVPAGGSYHSQRSIDGAQPRGPGPCPPRRSGPRLPAGEPPYSGWRTVRAKHKACLPVHSGPPLRRRPRKWDVAASVPWTWLSLARRLMPGAPAASSWRSGVATAGSCCSAPLPV